MLWGWKAWVWIRVFSSATDCIWLDRGSAFTPKHMLHLMRWRGLRGLGGFQSAVGEILISHPGGETPPWHSSLRDVPTALIDSCVGSMQNPSTFAKDSSSPTLGIGPYACLLRSRAAHSSGSDIYLRGECGDGVAARRAGDCALSQRKVNRRGDGAARQGPGGLRGQAGGNGVG